MQSARVVPVQGARGDDFQDLRQIETEGEKSARLSLLHKQVLSTELLQIC
jgi:hypothetical protein